MSVLRRLLGNYSGPPNPATGPSDDFWYERVGGTMTSAGERISPETALRVSTFYRGVRVIAEGVAKLPCKMYRRLPRGRQTADDHPIADLLKFQPNQWQTAFDWFEMMTGHALMRGNAYSEIIPGRRGFADQLVPLDPRLMKVVPLGGEFAGRVNYEYRQADGNTRIYTQDQILHFRGPGDGVEGWSLVALMREALGLARGAEGFGAEQFGRAPMMAGFLVNENGVAVDPDAKKSIGEAFRTANAGRGKRHGVAVLTGLKWQSIGMNLEEAQFLETRQFQREEIAAFLGIPPHKLGILDKATFSNIEHQAIEFVTDCLLPWLVRWEQTITRDLILDPRTYMVKFNLDSLLRGTTKERAEAERVWVEAGILTRNECREMEERNPLEGLDEPLVPSSNAQPASTVTDPKPVAGGRAPRNGHAGAAAANRVPEAGA